MRKPIVHSSRQLLFFAESSALCFPNKDVPENITTHTLFFIQSFSHPFGDIKVRKIHIHTFAYTIVCLLPYQISLRFQAYIFCSNKNDDGQFSQVLMLRMLPWSYSQKTYKLSKTSPHTYMQMSKVVSHTKTILK